MAGGSATKLESRLDGISRKFIRRRAKDPPEGYATLVELSADMDNAIDILLLLDPTDSPSPAHTEYWIRVTNDYVSDVEDWPYTRKIPDQEATIASIKRVCGRLDALLVQRVDQFTQTQRTRLLSLGLRARQVTQEQLLTGTVDAFGDTLI